MGVPQTNSLPEGLVWGIYILLRHHMPGGFGVIGIIGVLRIIRIIGVLRIIR